ncbi:MAG: hypothetical protein Q7T73_03350 [Beijerinckiaceae bacterium]|nr:hypothetical protein [Beijerinckiaceae bacterium]
MTIPEAGAASGSQAAERLAKGPRCQGKKATIVGKPRGKVRGTRGADVVVTNGASYIETFGGNDLVCVDRVASKNSTAVHIKTGVGNDRVVVTTKQKRAVWATLGQGADSFVGGSGPDQVVTGVNGMGAFAPGPDNERDVVDTRGGNDDVYTAGVTGSRDVVRLGDGDDQVYFRAPRTLPGALLDGGPGRDEINSGDSYSFEPNEGALYFDNTTGSGTRNGQPWLNTNRLEVFRIGVTDSMTFRGNDSAEVLYLTGSYALDADMGGGSDSVSGVPSDRPRVIVGGEGDDSIGLSGLDGLVVDVAAGTAVSSKMGQPDKSFTFTGFTQIAATATNNVSVTGSDGDDVISALACSVVLSGGEGADRLTVNFLEDFNNVYPCDVADGDVRGDDGDDVLTGSTGNDTLIGGDGIDRAAGGPGTDTCDAETKVACES